MASPYRLLKQMSRFQRYLVIVVTVVLLFVANAVFRKGTRGAVSSHHKTLTNTFLHSLADKTPSRLMDVYTARRQHLQDMCKLVRGKGKTENILVYKNMSYGVVPKAGCTFWIRVFRFLHNDTMGRVLKSPLEMTRSEAHGGPRKIKMYRLENPDDYKVVMSTKRFMVARNPFSRLFSAYMDKLFLPDYWSSAGTTLASRRANVSELSLKCGHDVSFIEFLSYIVDVGGVKPWSLNGHWRPIEHYCNPCIFKPDIIATQETYSKDAQYILNKFGLGQLIQNHSHSDHVLDEMHILTDWNFGFHGDCLSRRQLAGRLWKTFQVNGYLPPGTESVLEREDEHKLNKTRLKELISQIYSRHGLTKHQSRTQRNLSLKRAYRNVPMKILKKVVNIYSKDFLYFGYDSSIEMLLR